MEVKRTLVKRDEIEAPAILYKYRMWDDHRHRTMLSQQTVFMAEPSTFEDEMEFKNFKRYEDMTDEETLELFMRHSRIINPALSDEQLLIYAEQWMLRSPIKDEATLKAHRSSHYAEYDKTIGVLSLTPYNDDQTMWKKYGGKGKGFCVGFDTQLLFRTLSPKGSIAKVRYFPELPVIRGTDPYEVEQFKQTFCKLDKWEFEREHRCTIFNRTGLDVKERKVRVPVECIKEIVLGWEIPAKERKVFFKLYQKANLKAILFQAFNLNRKIDIRPL